MTQNEIENLKHACVILRESNDKLQAEVKKWRDLYYNLLEKTNHAEIIQGNTPRNRRPPETKSAS